MIRFKRRRFRRLARAPFADLPAIMLAEIEQLDASQISGFARPKDARSDLHGLGKAIEREGEASDKIGSQVCGRREQETVLAYIEKEASLRFVFVEGNEDRRLRDDARIEAAFDNRS